MKYRLVALVLTAFLMQSCAFITVKDVEVTDMVSKYQDSVVSTGELSLLTTQLLGSNEIPEEAEEESDAEAAFKVLTTESTVINKYDQVYAAAEYSLYQAMEHQGDDELILALKWSFLVSSLIFLKIMRSITAYCL